MKNYFIYIFFSLFSSIHAQNYSDRIDLDSSKLVEYLGAAKQLEINNYKFKSGIVTNIIAILTGGAQSISDVIIFGDTSKYSSIPTDDLHNKFPRIDLPLNIYNINSKGENDRYLKYVMTFTNGKLDFEVGSISLNNQLLVNRKEYCTMYYEMSADNEKNIDSVMNLLKTKYPLKIYETISWGSNYSVYKLKLKGILPKDDYIIDYQFVPEDDVEAVKTTRNAIIDEDEFVPVEKCQCEKLDPVVFLNGIYSRKVNSKKIYNSKSFQNTDEELSAIMDISYQMHYLMFRLKDYKIIQYGTMSAISTWFSKWVIYE